MQVFLRAQLLNGGKIFFGKEILGDAPSKLVLQRSFLKSCREMSRVVINGASAGKPAACPEPLLAEVGSVDLCHGIPVLADDGPVILPEEEVAAVTGDSQIHTAPAPN